VESPPTTESEEESSTDIDESAVPSSGEATPAAESGESIVQDEKEVEGEAVVEEALGEASGAVGDL
jgi:hypothetical protein